ncbi:hypothetical protein KY284_015152 [Solanum tuberosum]|nr:hypothetical protein KY284_015152 [Solanum tuberosum]
MVANNAYQLDPGPLDPCLLTEQLTHRSRDIWIGNDNMILNTRKCENRKVVFLRGKHIQVPNSPRSRLPDAELYSLGSEVHRTSGKFWDLVNEYPIHPRVLDDVEILYGLPVKGNPIVGYEPQRSVVDWQNICQRLLGFTPHPQDFKHNSLKVSALNAYLRLQPRLPDLATQDMVNEKARCYMFWIITGLMLADTSGGLLKLMYLPMLEDITAVGSYSWGSATLAYLYRFLCKASQSIQNEIVGFLPLLQIWAWERVTVLRPQIVAQRDTRNIFPVGLPRGPHAAGWFAHFSWTDTTKHVLRVFRDALDSMTEDQAIPSPFPFDATHFHHDRRGRPNTNWERITRFIIGNLISSPQQQQGYVPNATAYETMARHIHLMVNKAISLGDNPSMEEFYGFRAMVRDEGSNCLAYVQEADRIHVQANYRRDELMSDHLHPLIRRRGKGGVAGRKVRVVERGRAPIEMGEDDQAI